MTPGRPGLSPERLPELQALLSESRADGWLLYDFHDQNPVAHRLLGAGRTTRQAFALFPRAGEPILLRHTIEGSAWVQWPWRVIEYRGWRELAHRLQDLVSGLDTVAMEVSAGGAVPSIDRVPHGVVARLLAAGVQVVSSADLVTVFYSSWSEEGLRLHRKASESIRTIAHEAFRHAAARAADLQPVTEAELMGRIRSQLREEGLTDQEDCIVAGGARSADPHYQPEGSGEPLRNETVLLIDLWGRHPNGGIPADQTWMGYLGPRSPERLQQTWVSVREARDAALELLTRRTRAGKPVMGWEVDAVARETLAHEGLDSYFIHRLGHSIDSELHGSGPNLDDLETHDDRHLLPGVGFSVEPGVYIPGEFGVRSEVNVYLALEGPEVTPSEVQRELLTPETA